MTSSELQALGLNGVDSYGGCFVCLFFGNLANNSNNRKHHVNKMFALVYEVCLNYLKCQNKSYSLPVQILK